MDWSSANVRNELREARSNRERLFGEIENLRARVQGDGDDAGLDERIANLNRAVEKADDRVVELEAELGRAAYMESIADDPKHREADAGPVDRGTIGPRS